MLVLHPEVPGSISHPVCQTFSSKQFALFTGAYLKNLTSKHFLRVFIVCAIDHSWYSLSDTPDDNEFSCDGAYNSLTLKEAMLSSCT